MAVLAIVLTELSSSPAATASMRPKSTTKRYSIETCAREFMSRPVRCVRLGSCCIFWQYCPNSKQCSIHRFLRRLVLLEL